MSHSACKSFESFSVFSITWEHTESLIRSAGKFIVWLNETERDLSDWMQRSVSGWSFQLVMCIFRYSLLSTGGRWSIMNRNEKEKNGWSHAVCLQASADVALTTLTSSLIRYWSPTLPSLLSHLCYCRNTSHQQQVNTSCSIKLALLQQKKGSKLNHSHFPQKSNFLSFFFFFFEGFSQNAVDSCLGMSV